MPLLYKKSKNINLSQLIFSDINDEINTYEIFEKKIIFYKKKNDSLLNQNEITIVMNNNEIYKNIDKNILISEKKIQQNLSKSLTPKFNAWNTISKIANKTFVPESDESRNKGAGGGDDND